MDGRLTAEEAVFDCDTCCGLKYDEGLVEGSNGLKPADAEPTGSSRSSVCFQGSASNCEEDFFFCGLRIAAAGADEVDDALNPVEGVEGGAAYDSSSGRAARPKPKGERFALLVPLAREEKEIGALLGTDPVGAVVVGGAGPDDDADLLLATGASYFSGLLDRGKDELTLPTYSRVPAPASPPDPPLIIC